MGRRHEGRTAMTRHHRLALLSVTIFSVGIAGCTSPSSPPPWKPPSTSAKPNDTASSTTPAPTSGISKSASTSSAWQVGDYRVKQVKAREEAASAALYTPDQGVVTTIDSISASPRELRPGEQVNLKMEYTVLGPPQTREIKVREVRSIYFNNQHLVDLAAKELTLRQGTNEIHDTMRLPGNAADGAYAVVMSVEVVAPSGWRQVRGQAAFVVKSRGTAAVVQPANAPTVAASTTPPATPAPSAPRPPTSTVAVPPQATSVMYVQIPMANIREGAGVGYAVVGRIPRGTRLDVLETRGSDADRWFRVRVAGGQEGWVAASALSASQ